MMVGAGRIVLGIAVLAAGVTLIALQAPAPAGERLVFTQIGVPVADSEPDWRFPTRSRIVALDLTDPEAEPVVLTPEFAAARAPDVHFDARRIVFAGQREAGGPWQIWERDLGGGEPRLRVPSCERCRDPVYRPDDGIVFVAPADDASTAALYTVGPGEERPRRITHHPLSDASPTLVSDGRVVLATGTDANPGAATDYYALRHDGTGAELLYATTGGATLAGRAHQSAGRDLVFVERSAGNDAETVVSVSLAYPATSRRERPVPPGARAHSIFPLPDGSLVVALQADGSSVYSLWRLPAGEGSEEPLTAADPSRHAVEPVLAVRRQRPLGFVSALQPGAASGTLFGFDARLTGLGSIDSAASAIRVRTPAGELGTVPLAPDGSFHIELPANTPIRLETLDRDGRVVRGPSAWMWVGPGELRGCVGCHEDRALTPENRLPAAAGDAAISLLPGRVPTLAEEDGP